MKRLVKYRFMTGAAFVTGRNGEEVPFDLDAAVGSIPFGGKPDVLAVSGGDVLMVVDDPVSTRGCRSASEALETESRSAASLSGGFGKSCSDERRVATTDIRVNVWGDGTARIEQRWIDPSGEWCWLPVPIVSGGDPSEPPHGGILFGKLCK